MYVCKGISTCMYACTYICMRAYFQDVIQECLRRHTTTFCCFMYVCKGISTCMYACTYICMHAYFQDVIQECLRRHTTTFCCFMYVCKGISTCMHVHTYVCMHITRVSYKNAYGDTPLHFAALWGRLEILNILLKAGEYTYVHLCSHSCTSYMLTYMHTYTLIAFEAHTYTRACAHAHIPKFQSAFVICMKMCMCTYSHSQKRVHTLSHSWGVRDRVT
jgi:hypothetical protein